MPCGTKIEVLFILISLKSVVKVLCSSKSRLYNVSLYAVLPRLSSDTGDKAAVVLMVYY